MTNQNTKKREYLYPDFSKFQQIADGTYEAYGEIQLDDIIFDQEYVLGHIADWLGREGPQNLYYIGEEWDSDLTSLGFKIEGLEGVSNTTPEIVDLKIEKEYQSDDSIKQINISTIIDSEYELENASFYIRNIDSGNALDYFAVWPDSWKVNSLGQYLGEYKVDAASMYDPSTGSANDKYTLFGFRVEDIHGNYTMLQEKDLNDFFEKFDFEIASEKPKKHYEVELISIKADKEYYLPHEQGELLIELKTENEINGLMSTIFDIDGRADYMTHPYTESDFVKNSAGNYVIKQKFSTPYFLSDASYVLRDIDVFFSAENDWRTYDYNVKVGEEFLEPLFHVRYQEVPKVETKFETITETIAYETQYLNNDKLDIGLEKILTVGVDGERTIVEEITYTEGEAPIRKVVSNTVTKQPITRIIEKGTRLTEIKFETRTEKVVFETIYKDNNNLDIGTEKVVTAGIDGIRTIVESVTYVNGKETNRVISSSNITTDPITRVIERGTKLTEVKTETRNEVLPFETSYIYNPDLKVGIENIVTEGVNGIVSITEEVTYVNGVVQSRKITTEVVSAEPINEVIEHGSKGTLVVSETTKEALDFEIEYVDNANLDLGFTNILTPGVKGEYIIIEEVTYINGEEKSRVEISNEVTQAPTTQIVERGTRLTEVKTETRTEEIPFKIVYKENPELAEGKSTILISGVTGTRAILEEVTYVNGVLTERVIMSSEVTKEAINQIVEIGISAEETPAEKPEQPSQGEKVETPVTGYSEASISQAGIAMLPETGEKENFALFTTASLAILAGLGLITSAKRKED